VDTASPVCAPRVDRDVDQAAAEPPVFGAETIGDDIDPLNAVGRKALAERSPIIDDLLAAVHLNVVESRGLAIDRKVLVLGIDECWGEAEKREAAALRIDRERRDVA